MQCLFTRHCLPRGHCFGNIKWQSLKVELRDKHSLERNGEKKFTFFLFVRASVQYFITLLIKGRWRGNRDILHEAFKNKPGWKKEEEENVQYNAPSV